MCVPPRSLLSAIQSAKDGDTLRRYKRTSARAEEALQLMPYYVLLVDGKELYVTNNMMLSEDEALRYGSEGKMMMVRALLVWVGFEPFRTFQQQLLSFEQHNQNYSPFQELLQDMHAGRLTLLELKALHLSYQLRRYSTQVEFVAINPGPQQRVQKIEEFLEGLDV